MSDVKNDEKQTAQEQPAGNGAARAEVPETAVDEAPPETAADGAPEEVSEDTEEQAEEAEEIDEVEALRSERDALNDRLLRTAAELQNFRRRTEAERGRLAEAGKARVLRPLLDVLDDFERSLEAARELDAAEAPEAAFTSLREGVELVFRKFSDELARLGVEPIEAEGQPFDEHLHEALMQQPAPEGVAPGTVLQEVQKGYRLDERVLRHSKVVVGS